MQIIVADDHPVVLMGIKALFKSHGDTFQVTGEVNTGSDLLSLLSTQPCDLLITDFSMPDQRGSSDGLPLLKRLQRHYPELPVIVLTMVHNQTLIRGMLACGVRGVVNKAELTKELLLAVQAVSNGRTYLSERIRSDASISSVQGNIEDAVSATGPDVLSTREAEIVRLYARGLTITQIAEQVHRSVKTVSQQKNDAMRKLGLISNSQLYEYAKAYGLLS